MSGPYRRLRQRDEKRRRRALLLSLCLHLVALLGLLAWFNRPRPAPPETFLVLELGTPARGDTSNAAAASEAAAQGEQVNVAAEAIGRPQEASTSADAPQGLQEGQRNDVSTVTDTPEDPPTRDAVVPVSPSPPNPSPETASIPSPAQPPTPETLEPPPPAPPTVASPQTATDTQTITPVAAAEAFDDPSPAPAPPAPSPPATEAQASSAIPDTNPVREPLVRAAPEPTAQPEPETPPEPSESEVIPDPLPPIPTLEDTPVTPLPLLPPVIEAPPEAPPSETLPAETPPEITDAPEVVAAIPEVTVIPVPIPPVPDITVPEETVSQETVSQETGSDTVSDTVLDNAEPDITSNAPALTTPPTTQPSPENLTPLPPSPQALPPSTQRTEAPQLETPPIQPSEPAPALLTPIPNPSDRTVLTPLPATGQNSSGSTPTDTQPEANLGGDAPTNRQPSPTAVASGPGLASDPRGSTNPTGAPPSPQPYLLQIERPLTVMLDNVRGYPQNGLNEATFIAEMPVEGEQTRLMAVFDRNTPSRIGPVRSARDYFVTLSQGLNGVMVHAGGSPSALSLIAQTQQATFDSLKGVNNVVFARDSTSPKPYEYTLYTSGNALRNQMTSRGWNWSRTAQGEIYQPESQAPSRNQVSVNFGANQSAFRYASDRQVYRWLRSNVAAVDANGLPVYVDAVVVAYVTANVISGDREGRLNIPLNGGSATLHLKGKRIPGRWSRAGGFAFTTLNGEAIDLRPFKVWVMFVPPWGTVY